MTEFTFRMNDAARQHMAAIALQMTAIFAMPEEEAVGRINRHFENSEFESDDQVDPLTHETAEFWAKWIAYGKKDFWVNEGGLSLQPYP